MKEKVLKKIQSIFASDDSALEPDLRLFFLIERIKYIAALVLGIAFGIASKETSLALLYLAIVLFLVYERHQDYKDACAENLVVVEGTCQRSEQQSTTFLGKQLFGPSHMDIFATDGHVYSVPMSKVKQIDTGDMVRLYVSKKHISQKDEDTYLVNPYLYIKKLKNAPAKQS